MKALNLYGVNDLRYDDVPMPIRQNDEVLLRVRAAGICGSDIPRVFTKGTYHFPTIIGHEFAGEIVEADDASLLGRGASVFPLLPCGQCSACQTGNYAQCHQYSYYGSRQDGGMAEYIAVKRKNICLLPEGVSYEEAAMNEPAAVARHAFLKSKAGLGDTLLIYGIGTIGLIIAQWARAAGVRQIIMAGRTEAKTALAVRMGFMPVNTSQVDLEAYIQQKTDGRGCDACIEGTGSSEGVEMCLRAAGDFAQVVLMGNPLREIQLSQDGYWKILRKELCVSGTWNSSFNSMENDWQQALQGMQTGVLDLQPLITHRFHLADYAAAFSLMREKKKMYLKVMFILDRGGA